MSLALVAAAAAPSRAQLDQWGYWENGVTESWWLSSADFTKEEAERAFSLWKSIGEAKPDAAGGWAGDYFRGGSTHGTYLRWSPEGGFLFAGVNKCEARVMGVAYGRVAASPPAFEFVTEFRKRAASHGHGHARRADDSPTALRYVPVEWAGQRLLVSEEELPSFADYVAGLGEYNFWLSSQHFGFDMISEAEFYTRIGPSEAGAAGDGAEAIPSDPGGREVAPPVVPPGYERFLKKPIEATVTAVGRRRVRRDLRIRSGHGEVGYGPVALTDVTVDAGTADGLKPGMFLLVRQPEEGDRVRVVRVGSRSSAGVLIRELGDGGRETFTDGDTERPHSKVSVGWKLTTWRF